MASGTFNFTTFTDLGGGNFPWSNVANAAASDNVYATAVQAVAGQTSSHLRCTGIDDATIPLNAVINGIEAVVECKRSVSGSTLSMRTQLTQSGATIGAQSSTLTPGTTDADKTYGGAADQWSVSGGLTRAMLADSTFGFELWTTSGSTWVGTISVDYARLVPYWTERTAAALTATAQAHQITLTWTMPTDWDDLQAGSSDTRTEAWRWIVETSPTGAFAGEETVYYVPSVADSRGQVYQQSHSFDPGFEPSDVETFIFRVPTSSDGVIYRFRVALARFVNGAIDEQAPYASTVQVGYAATNESAVLNEALDTASLAPDIGKCRLLLGFLIGGSLGASTNAQDYLGINTTFHISDSMPAYTAGIMETALTTYLADQPLGTVGFFIRAPFGVNSRFTDADTPPNWTTYWNLQGGRLPDDDSWTSTGGGTSPGMLTPFDCYNHALGLGAGTPQTRIISLVDDVDEYTPYCAQTPVVFYYSPFASAHRGDKTNSGWLVANGAHILLNRGGFIAWDVAGTADLVDRETLLDTPEKAMADALQAFGRPFFFETVASGSSSFQAITDGYSKMGDVQAFDLHVNDTTYSAAKSYGVRLNLNDYVKGGRADLPSLPESFRLILRISPNTCAFVATGSDNEEKMKFALDVALDARLTWGDRVIPCIENQTQWDEVNKADIDAYMLATRPAQLLARNASLGVSPFFRHSLG